MSLLSEWYAATITVATDSQNSAEVDLRQGSFEAIEIDIPAIDSAEVQIKGANESGGTFDLIGQEEPIPASLGGFRTTVPVGGKYQYIKVYTSAVQTSDRVFYVRGVSYASAGLVALIDRLKNLLGVAKTVSVTKEIAAAGAHVAEDVLSESVGAGTVWTWAAIFRANNTGGYITKAQVICERTAKTPRLTLYLFNAAPTCNLNDNVANTAPVHADAAKYLGKIDFPALEDLGGDSVAVVTPSTYGNLPMWVDAASDADDLIGVLVTRDGVTLTATDELIIKLTLEQY